MARRTELRPGQVTTDLLVQIRCAFHAMVELVLETGLCDLRRCVVAVHRGKILAFLGKNAMAVEIAIEAEITEDVEGIIDVFERAG